MDTNNGQKSGLNDLERVHRRDVGEAGKCGGDTLREQGKSGREGRGDSLRRKQELEHEWAELLGGRRG